jgi:hypothetical protein
MFRIIVLAAAVSATVADAQDKQPCVFPLATQKQVALGIFNAIASGRQTVRGDKYETKIDDQGDSWSIYQVLKGGDSVKEFTGKNGQRSESVNITAGGGGLEMIIDKCTAVVSDAHLSR